MSFWSKLGNIALTVAPYAAMAIPGVGIPLGMAIQGGLAAAKTKASGGSWKNALISGGIGAGTAAIGGGALSKIGPSSGVAAKMLGGAAGKSGLGVSGAIGKGLGSVATGALGGIGGDEGTYGSGPVQGNPNAMSMTGTRQGKNPATDQNIPSGINQGQSGQNSAYYKAIRQKQPQTNQPIGPSYQYPQGGQDDGQDDGGGGGYQPQGNQGGGSGGYNPATFRQYTGEDVGHEGTTRGGMNRQQYRDAWMGSGIGNNQQMDAWLAANGGQRLNDSGVVRTPFGEILDMGIGYKGGRGQAGWTDIGMNNLAANQGWGQAYNPPPIGPSQPPPQPEAPEPSYEDFVRDYWAPDRDAVLAARAPQNQPPPLPANQTYARKIGRGGQYVYDY